MTRGSIGQCSVRPSGTDQAGAWLSGVRLQRPAGIASFGSMLAARSRIISEADDADARTASRGLIETWSAHDGQADLLRVHVAPWLRARGQDDLALAELERAIAADPSLAEARFERGLARAAKPELGDAERRQAIADLSTDLPATAALGDGEPAMRWSASAFDFEQGHCPIYLAREQLALPTTLLGLDAALVTCAARCNSPPTSPTPSSTGVPSCCTTRRPRSRESRRAPPAPRARPADPSGRSVPLARFAPPR